VLYDESPQNIGVYETSIDMAFVVTDLRVAIAASGLAATIAGWAGALVPVLSAVGTFVAAVVGWPLVIGAALIGIGVLLYTFRGKIGEFFGWVVKGVLDLISGIGKALAPIGSFIGKALSSIVQFVVEYYKSLYALFVFYIITPIKQAWDGLMVFFGQKLAQFVAGIGVIWSAISTAFANYVTIPLTNAWNTYINYLGTALAPVVNAIGKAWSAISTGFTTYVSGPISKAWSGLIDFLGKALSNVTGGITRLWTGMVDGIKGALRGLLQFAANALNGVIGAINRVIQGINVTRAAVNMGPLGQMSYIQVPAFAEGGVVNRPTLAMVGEGGQAEYIIPASKMAAASANYLGGSRGASVLTGGSRGGVTPQINIQTGPVMQTADGQQWVSLADLERAQRQTVAAVMGQLRTPAGRYAVGAR
jgi:phage-related protein